MGISPPAPTLVGFALLGLVLFDGLGFAVGPGRSGLVGANGSGKSTLLDNGPTKPGQNGGPP
jgi:ABC-type hemin transport system ATPase subunit